MKKRVLAAVFAFVLLMTLVFTACSPKKSDSGSTEPAPTEMEKGSTAAPEENSDLEDVKAAGKLVIGITYFAPMNYMDDSGELTGFETEFAKAVAEKLGVEAEFKEINWNNKIIELKGKTIDCIWNGMTKTDELAEQLDFSNSYMTNKQVCVVKASKADTYKDLASMAGAAVVAEAGSAGETAVKADSGLSQNYVSVSAQADGLNEVKAGTADIVVLDAVMAYSMVGEGTDYDDLTVVDVFDSSADEEYAIGFRQGSSLTKAVNEAMDSLAKDGTLKTIASKYGLESRILLSGSEGTN